MAYTVSQTFKTNIKDSKILKSCIILFDDLWFDSNDISIDSLEFNQFFNTSDDLTFGDCPSDTLSFAILSDGKLSGYQFGKAKTYLGVQTATAEYAFSDINAHIEVGNNSYTASTSGLYRNSTKIDSSIYVSLVSDGTTVWAVGRNSAVQVVNASGIVSSYTPNAFMANKLQKGISAIFISNTAKIWDGENVLTYEYVPMGVYNVTKPRSTVGDIVTIQDAYDNMILFDRDATEFINSLTYPKTLSQIYVALCNYVGVSYVSSTFTYSTTSYSSSPFSDTKCTCRDILWWIAERARRVAHFNRNGVLDLISIGTVQETITATDIAMDGYSIAEYVTPKVTGVLLRGSSGNSLSFGDTKTTPYVISANPFIGTITNADLQAYWDIPTYVPITLDVLEADPSIDIGDFVSIKPMVEEYKVLTNVYNEIYVNANREAYAVGSPTYSIPIMNRTVHFNGGIRATYTATGNEQREADLDNTEYNADVAANMAVDKSKAYSDSVGQEVDESFTQQKVFNRLTDNGRAQGIFMDENGDIYFNAAYINSGYISADRIQANSIAVSKLTGNITNGGWKIDLDNGTMTLGKLAVGSITGSKSLGNNWSINFDTGVMTIGTLNADNINGGTIKGSSINLGNGNFVVNGSTGAVTIKSGSINLGNGVFAVTNTGAVTASNISATGGSIGGFDIDSTSIHTHNVAITSNATNSVGLSSSTFTRTIGGTSTSNLKFAIGANFGVTNDGTLYTRNAQIFGESLNIKAIQTGAQSTNAITVRWVAEHYTEQTGIAPAMIQLRKYDVEQGYGGEAAVTIWYNMVGVSDTNGSSQLWSNLLQFSDSGGTRLSIRPSSSGNITIQPTVVSTW